VNLSHRTFVGAVVAGVVVLCTVGVALTADYTSPSSNPSGNRAGEHNRVAHGGYVDDKDDDSEDVARDRSVRCVFAERPGCPQS
jgi:hypothetical protein